MEGLVDGAELLVPAGEVAEFEGIDEVEKLIGGGTIVTLAELEDEGFELPGGETEALTVPVPDAEPEMDYGAAMNYI